MRGINGALFFPKFTFNIARSHFHVGYLALSLKEKSLAVMIQKCVVLIIISLCGTQLSAQDQSTGNKAAWYLGLTGSTQGYVSKAKSNDNIRAIRGSNHSIATLKSHYNSSGIGLTLDRIAPSGRFSFSSGAHYLMSESAMRVRIGNLYDANFFYVRYRQVGTETDYATANAVSQTAHYITVPMIARWFPLNSERAKFYLMAGGNVNFLMQYKNSVELNSIPLAPFQSNVEEVFEAPRDRTASLFAGLGFRYGATGKPTVGFELNLPSGFLTPNSVGITRATTGMGVSLAVAFPLNAPPTP